MPGRTASPADALRRMRRLAGAVLGLLAAVFLATHLAPDTAAVRLVRAMAEAGMIGGLADWFAVEALFRRPLGLPIPHTALLPRNQARAARNVGRFFEAHFLEPASLRERLRALEPGRHCLDWLRRPENAGRTARELIGLAGALLDQGLPPRVAARSRAWARAQAGRAAADAAIARALAQLVKQGVRSTVAADVVTMVRDAIDQNRELAVELIQDRSRWWIASAVDRRIAGLVVDGVLSLLEDLRTDGSALRHDFQAAFDRAVDALSVAGTLDRAVGEMRHSLVRSGVIDAELARLAEGLRSRLRARIADDPEALAAPLAGLIRDVARRARDDGATRAALDARMADLAAEFIGDMRPAVAGYIADVIAGWEPDELNARFEQEIGPDLQFIRINGAVLGALIGGLIFAVNTLLG